MKTLYMETTQKDPSETAGEIQKFLKDYGLSRFMLNYKNGDIAGVVFAIDINGKEIPYKMPCNHLPLWKMAQARETKYIKTEDQARRVAWRQVLKWIQAQMALIETGIVKLEEVFLPYMIVDNKKELTVFDKYKINQPMLPGGENG